jgi:hypothetical protein
MGLLLVRAAVSRRSQFISEAINILLTLSSAFASERNVEEVGVY